MNVRELKRQLANWPEIDTNGEPTKVFVWAGDQKVVVDHVEPTNLDRSLLRSHVSADLLIIPAP